MVHSLFPLLSSLLCSSAIVLSGYALYVEVSKESDENFEAICDISPEMSCSSVLTSRCRKWFSRQIFLCACCLGYGALQCMFVYIVNSDFTAWHHNVCLPHSYSKGFGVLGLVLGEDHPLNVHNSLYGIIFYTFTLILSELPVYRYHNYHKGYFWHVIHVCDLWPPGFNRSKITKSRGGGKICFNVLKFLLQASWGLC